MKHTKEQWTRKDETGMQHIGIIEFQVNDEWNSFEVYLGDGVLIFGSHTNIGLLQSGFMWMDEFSSEDSELQELIEELETFYRDGADYCTRIVVNDRM